MNSLSAVSKSVQNLTDEFLTRLPYLLMAVVVFLMFVLLSRGLRSVVMRVAHGATGSRRYVLGLVLGRLTAGTTLLVGLLVALSVAIPGFTLEQLVSLLGIGGVAIGFAFQNILQNFLSGILLLISEPFRIGDQISVTGFEGTVEDIQTRATFIKTYDGQRVVIPNATLFTNAVTVVTAYDKRRLQQDIKINDDQHPQAARQAMLAALASLDGIAKEPAPTARIQDLGDASLVVRLAWWIEPPTQNDANASRDEVLEVVRKALADTRAGNATPPPASP